MLINNNTDAKTGKIKGYLYLEGFLGFRKTFKKVTKKLGFHLMFKANDLQNIIYSSRADDINVTIYNLYLYGPNLLPSVETQVMLTEATQNNYKISYDEYVTERRIISDMISQTDIESSQRVNSPKYLIGAHQTRASADTANKSNNIAIFDNVSLQKFYIETDGVRYPRDSVVVNYEQNDYIEQYKDLKLFFREKNGEELLSPFIIYPDMKPKHFLEIIDLRHQPDHITPKKIQIFQEFSADPENARFFYY